ncbi:MAG: hypothetical protein WA980_04005 [Shinella zoogloeoides]|uniref:hypothetical protein n=1 Tax=Shinella zoogloeoides TaxID=352475 RepID=UPI003C72AE00
MAFIGPSSTIFHPSSHLSIVTVQGLKSRRRRLQAAADEKNICIRPNKSQFSAHRFSWISAIDRPSNM